MAIFSRQALLDADVKDVFAWHARPGAIERLSPPWDPLKVIRRSGGILPGAEVVLRMKAGPVPYHWHARHTRYEEDRLFEDGQVRGPFAEWVHTHAFEPAGDGQCRLTDTVRFRLPLAAVTQPLFSPLVIRKLERIFAFRHRVTAADLALHRQFGDRPRQTIVITGAGGVIGSRLVPFLTTGGHRVLTLVRRPPKTDSEIFWNPAAGQIDSERLEAARPDAVIHLAGENIGEGRWTAEKKRRIIDSREKGTTLITGAMARMARPPGSFLSASAIGYYGDRGDEIMTETSGPGGNFISRVCTGWEAAVQPAVDAGIRVVLMRIGVVLTPEGGALKKMLPLFRAGLGGRMGTGKQYLSWIGMDDAVGAIYHLLMRPDIAGPVNLVSPEPVTNTEFARILGKVLSRPAVLPVPEIMIKLAFGEMGREVPLAGTRVLPEKLLEHGYSFQYPQLPSCLAHLLGKEG
ncbi:MAG: TIGR01777 family oxidoreductase [Thermodesulfobacteriota bacterium]